MTISSETSRLNYTGNGATSVYSYTFRILDDDDLTVTVRSTLGVETTLTKTTDYTVSGVGVSAGGNITLVNHSQAWLTSGSLTSSYILTIRRVMDMTQPTDIRNQGDFLPETHEDEFDRLVMQLQTLDAENDAGIKLPETENPSSYTMRLPVQSLRASKVVGFDSTGNVTVVSNVPTSGVTATSFIETLLDDSSASQAKTTLDVKEIRYGSSNTGSDAYAVTVSPTLSAYADGVMIAFKADDVGNTGPATLNVGGLGAKAIVKKGTSGAIALVTGDILVDQYVFCIYNSASDRFEMFSDNYGEDSLIRYAVDSVGSDSYAITLPYVTALTTGLKVQFKAGTANTGAATLAVSGLTAKPLVDAHNAALITGAILSGDYVSCVYDGTSFVILSPLTPLVVQDEIWLSTNTNNGSTNTAIGRFVTTNTNTSTSMTLAQSSTDGDTITINVAGIYSVTYAGILNVNAYGISKNSNQLTTAVGSITATHRLSYFTSGNNIGNSVVGNVTFYAAINDVIRYHTGVAAPVGAGGDLRIVRVK